MCWLKKSWGVVQGLDGYILSENLCKAFNSYFGGLKDGKGYNHNRKGRSLCKYCKVEAVDYDRLIQY